MGRAVTLMLPWIVAALAAATVAVWLKSGTSKDDSTRAALDVATMLAGESGEGYLRADGPREFEFPRDHGPHDGFRTEWWYFTGNVDTASGQAMGYQLTFFRTALTPRPTARPSTLAADHIWMAHFALSDISARRFHAFEHHSREAGDLAGAGREPLRVWLNDWSAEFDASGTTILLKAREGNFALDLTLRGSKAPVLNGAEGLSRKNAVVGGASYYYSMTRLATSGSIELDGRVHAVEGQSWMDREWMSGTLGSEQIGWDWFALQLDDGSEVMCSRMRRSDGTRDAFDSGSIIDAQGKQRTLTSAEFDLGVLVNWTSPRSKLEYPAGWTLRVPAMRLELEILPAQADQELGLSFRYWEGAVKLLGTRDGKPIAGRGYAELVGYGSRPPSSAALRAR